MNRMMRPNIQQFQKEQRTPVHQPVEQSVTPTTPQYEQTYTADIPQTPYVVKDNTPQINIDVVAPSVRTTMIKAENKVTVKIGESFYGFQYTEERAVSGDVDLDTERKNLVDTVNGVIDAQIAELMESMSN